MEKKKQNKLLEVYSGITYQQLKHITNFTSNDDVPLVYGEIVNTTKHTKSFAKQCGFFFFCHRQPLTCHHCVSGSQTVFQSLEVPWGQLMILVLVLVSCP